MPWLVVSNIDGIGIEIANEAKVRFRVFWVFK